MQQQVVRDMSLMKKPKFEHIDPMNYRFVVTNSDMDEFALQQQKFPFDLLNIDLPMKYQTMYGDVDGLLTFNRRIIKFSPNINSIEGILKETSIKRVNSNNDDIQERFSFKIHFDDIFFVETQNKSENILQLIIYLFGVAGLIPPIKDGFDQYAVIKVSLTEIEDQKKEEEFRKIVEQVMQKQCLGTTVELINELMEHILQLNKYKGNATSFRQLVSKCESQKFYTNHNMICYSEIHLYDLVTIHSVEHKFVKSTRHCAYRYKIKKPQLNKPTFILTQEHFNILVNALPELLQSNNWYLVYNPKVHGTSYEELQRRTRTLEQHYLIIKDTHNKIFGAFLDEGWKHGNNYYGGSNTFVFKFHDTHIQCFKASSLNLSFQLCTDNGLFIGGEDSNAIKINPDLLSGESSGSITFNNPVLSDEQKFVIQDLEIWGVSDNCDLILRKLRLQSDFHIEY